MIPENREEQIRSADLRRTRTNEQAAAEMRPVRNVAKGYNPDYQEPIRAQRRRHDQENHHLPPLPNRARSGRQDIAQRALQNNGAAILNSNPVRQSYDAVKEDKNKGMLSDRPSYQSQNRYVKGGCYQVQPHPQGNPLNNVVAQVGASRPSSLNRYDQYSSRHQHHAPSHLSLQYGS